MKTTWYLHSHVVWLKAWYSSIGGVPLVCVAAHGGNPLMDCRIRQTATASPAEPGGLSLTLDWITLSSRVSATVCCCDSSRRRSRPARRKSRGMVSLEYNRSAVG